MLLKSPSYISEKLKLCVVGFQFLGNFQFPEKTEMSVIIYTLVIFCLVYDICNSAIVPLGVHFFFLNPRVCVRACNVAMDMGKLYPWSPVTNCTRESTWKCG